jgi:hypothetical protein
MAFYGKPVDSRKRAQPIEIEDIKKLRRRIEDYLRKYATEAQLIAIARILNIKLED